MPNVLADTPPSVTVPGVCAMTLPEKSSVTAAAASNIFDLL